MTSYNNTNTLRSVAGAAIAMVLALTFVTAAAGPAFAATPVNSVATSVIVRSA